MYTEVNKIGVDQAKVFQELTVRRKGLREHQGLQLAIADLEKLFLMVGKCQISRQVAKMLILIYTLLMMDKFILVSLLSFFYAKSG